MRKSVVFLLLATCAVAPSAIAQPVSAQAAQQGLPSGAAAEVVRDLIKVVRANYVFPEKAPAIVQRLEQGLASGRYATDNPASLAERLTKDMYESSGNDGHMYINFKPAEAKALGSPGAQPQPDPAFFQQQMANVNHGITELKVLPGNVRYMNTSQWFWDEKGLTKAVYDDAMRFLRGGDAIIIDLRGNGGGDAAAVQYVASHFLDPDTKIITFRSGPNEVEEGRSLRIAAGKITGKPLFVLIGPGSASASEEFAAHVKNFKLGTLVGKTTAGAGNPNGSFPVAHGFVASVSVGTAIHPVTNKGWEGTGISPDRDVELPRAIDVAHLEALKAQLATASPQKRAMLEWSIAGLSADGSTAMTAADFRAATGRYDGNRVISERDGRLYWKVGDRPEQELIPLSGRLFAIGQKFGSRAEFESNGGAVRLFRPGAPPERLAKIGG
jgi:hypothetical protein